MRLSLPILLVAASLTISQGCLWVCRVPTPKEIQYADDGTVTNRTWSSMTSEISEWDCYPLLWMRLHGTAKIWREMADPIPSNLRGEELARAKDAKRYAPVGLCVLWIGLPLDLVVDTLCLPFDLISMEE